MDRDYDVLLHHTGGVTPSQALALPHPNGSPPPAPVIHDARAIGQMAAEMQQLRQQLSQMQQQQHAPPPPPPPLHHTPSRYPHLPHQPYAHEHGAHLPQHLHLHHPQQQHAEYAPRRPSTHATHAQKIRHFPIGFVKAQVLAGSLAEIEVKPQVRFQGHRLAVGQSCARYFNIVDIKVGKDSQLAATGEMPAEAFSSVSVGTQMELDPAPPGIVITLIVRNVDANAQDFGAVLYGTVEEGED